MTSSPSERREYWTHREPDNEYMYAVEHVIVDGKLVRERDVGSKKIMTSRWFTPKNASFNIVQKTPHRPWELVKCRGKVKRLIGLEEWPPD